MRKISKYLLILLTLCALPVKISATESGVMNVMDKGVNLSSTQLGDLKQITFSETKMLKHLNNGEVIEYDFSQFDKVVFGEYIVSVSVDELTSEGTGLSVYLSEDKMLTVSSSAVINLLKLVDLSGKFIKVSITGFKTNNVVVPVNDLAIGMYVVLADTDTGIQTTKIIIN